MSRPVVTRGDRILLRYAESFRRWVGRHGQRGEVRVVSRGPGPINVLVELEAGERVVVPRGQVYPRTLSKGAQRALPGIEG